MTIKTPAAPLASASVLLKGLSDVAPSAEQGMLGGAEAAAAERPIPLYSLKLSDLTEGNGLAGAQQVGWRYLVYSPNSVGVADLDDKGGGGKPLFNGFYSGKRAECLNAALTYADEKYQSGGNVYEARVLEIPALYSAAIWLAGNGNIFIPFMENGQFCRIRSLDNGQFMTQLERAARAHDAHLERDKGSLEPG